MVKFLDYRKWRALHRHAALRRARSEEDSWKLVRFIAIFRSSPGRTHEWSGKIRKPADREEDNKKRILGGSDEQKQEGTHHH